MKVVKVKMNEIKPYYRNPRKNNNVQIVKDSINKYGFNVPILLDKKNVIIKGHTTYKALLELGFKEADCIIHLHLTPTQTKAYRIIDNKASEKGEWDFDKLILELKGIPDLEWFKEVFDDIDLEKMLDDQVGVAVPSVTASDIKDSEKDHSTIDIIEKEKIEVICPECGEVFFVDK